MRIDLAFGGDAETWARLQAVYDVAQVRKRADEFQITRLWPPERSTVAAALSRLSRASGAAAPTRCIAADHSLA